MRVFAALVVVLGAATLVAAGAIIASGAASGVQPWGTELSDNFVFAKALPFVVALGVAFGLLGALLASRSRRTRHGHVRRFSRATVIGHWVITVGFLLALPTGVWQYLGGILDVQAPIPLYLVYRVHYIGASIILFSVAYFLAYWWMTGQRSLLPARGEWRHHLRNFAHELPPPLGRRVAHLLRLHLGGRPAEAGQFTYYETAFSFPSWVFALGLITLTGLIKAMRYLVPVPGPILFGASTLHVAAMVLLVLKTLDNLRYVFARWPLMVAMTTTWVTDGYARLHHPGWHHPDKRQAA